ncbi:protein SERAC1 isoform X1 [Anopheles stephensi]|uniref:protein SERAC1 isoform X1 n=1 Tax=Anopheles stephensi TaxID=30069 RepID=UPI00165886E3|nr:protein SERAC1 isoform X1 [Anopheles stephensi]
MQIEYKKCTKLFSGCGVASLLGVLSYEAYRTYAALSSLVDTRVLDIDRKRPDYIYIKHHIYRQSLRERALDAENQHRLLNIVVQPFEKWWKALKHSVAWRLLRIAQQGDQAERLKAIHQLAQIDHLKDWDFQHLAQLCDHRTAISLARSNCDTRWFLPPRQYGVEKEMREVLVEMKSLLELLSPHKCAAYALEQTFGSSGHIREPDGDEVTYQMSPSRFEYDQLKQSLSALIHLTGLVGPEGKQHCRRIVDAGGLLMLLEAEKLFRGDIDMKLLISRLVGNLSACEGLGYEFYASGWIGILARWKRDVDMRMQVTADLTLENLDQDDPNGFRYAPKVYPLHPRGRQQAKPAVDVVFIHGLLGGVFVTWRQKDLKPQAASLLGKKHKDVHLVSTSCTDSSSTNNNDIALQRPPPPLDDLTNRTDHARRGPAASASRWYRSWSAKKSSFEEDAVEGAEEGIAPYKDELLTFQESTTAVPRDPSISDTETKELIEALQQEEPLGSDWTVVYPDVPLKADEDARSGKRSATADGAACSVSGDSWLQEPLESGQRSFCWPMEWLPKDFPSIRVLGLDYDSSLSQWSATGCPCEKYDGKLQKRAAEFLEKLATSDVGQDRPIIWVGHSMGGLLIKSIMVQALESPNPKVRRLAENSRVVMFLGTPHRGSGVAKLKQHTSALVWPSVEVQELEENSSQLLHLNKTFLRAVDGLGPRKPEIITLCEGRPTVLTSFKLAIHVVPESSARIDAGDFYLTSEDHLNLSKPICRQSFLYQRLVGAIQDAMRPSGAESSVPVAKAALNTAHHHQQQQLIFHGTKKSGSSASAALSSLYTQLKQFEQLMNVFL